MQIKGDPDFTMQDQGQILMKSKCIFLCRFAVLTLLTCPSVLFTASNTSAATQPNASGTGAAAGAAAQTGSLKATAVKAAKGAGAVVGTAVGGDMIYEATKGNEEHTAGNVIQGATGGVAAGAGIGAIWGPVGAAIGAAAGAVVGGTIAGSQLFSETDCLTDPVTGKFTCCHTAFNKGERQADIGDYMFCMNEQGTINFLGGVRQCQQGGTATKDSWWSGLWKDDAWSAGCDERYCEGETGPISGISSYITPLPDKDNFCWKWTCKEGFRRSGQTCIDIETNMPVDLMDPNKMKVNPYDALINQVETLRQQIISECGNM